MRPSSSPVANNYVPPPPPPPTHLGVAHATHPTWDYCPVSAAGETPPLDEYDLSPASQSKIRFATARWPGPFIPFLLPAQCPNARHVSLPEDMQHPSERIDPGESLANRPDIEVTVIRQIGLQAETCAGFPCLVPYQALCKVAERC